MKTNLPTLPVVTKRLLSIPLFIIGALALLLLAQPGAAQEPTLPEEMPDGFPGLGLYEQRCANCHGPTGAGDGEIAAQLPAPPKAFTDPTYRLETRPNVMFDQITNGEAAVAMPPFGPASSNPIDDQGRWDLVAAVYSLSTPPEAVAQGEQVYQASCAGCHGDTGVGDGPEMPADAPATDLTSLTYWFNRSNQDVFEDVIPASFPAHAYELADDDAWAVVDYARTFSYVYADPVALTAPVPSGLIFGQVLNGTLDEPLAGAVVNLRAFTPDFTQTMEMTTTVDSAGIFTFEVEDVPPDWVFIAGTRFDDLNYSSPADQLSAARTQLDLPITVYDRSTDPSAINIGQVHVVLEFPSEDQVRVNELYIFNNNQDAVFVGESGDPLDGTIQLSVPTGAEALEFQRSFGSMDSFMPANDFIQTDTGWADTLPLRPGDNALTLLVRYVLPYEDGMTVAHPLNYDADTSTIILSDVGVEVVGEEWTSAGPQEMGPGQIFLNYSRPPVAAGEPLAIELDGRPRQVAAAGGAATVPARNENLELIIGGAALLLVAGAGIVLWRGWQARQTEADEAYVTAVEAQVAVPVTPVTQPQTNDDADALLAAIADLDDAYEAGTLDEATYQQQRADLKRRLAAIWSS